MLWNTNASYNSLTLAPQCTALPLVVRMRRVRLGGRSLGGSLGESFGEELEREELAPPSCPWRRHCADSVGARVG